MEAMFPDSDSNLPGRGSSTGRTFFNRRPVFLIDETAGFFRYPSEGRAWKGPWQIVGSRKEESSQLVERLNPARLVLVLFDEVSHTKL